MGSAKQVAINPDPKKTAIEVAATVHAIVFIASQHSGSFYYACACGASDDECCNRILRTCR
jgi:hypothetical protein